jgi:hypothetical protein
MSETVLEEVLQAPRQDLIVEDGSEVRLEPANERVAHARHLIEIGSFRDLRTLSLIPEWLDERTARDAIAADDEEGLALAREYLQRAEPSCSCHGGPEPAPETPLKLSHRARLRRAYVGIRKSHHPHLARRMSEAGPSRYAFDDLHPAIVHGWLSRVSSIVAFPAPIWLWKDVKIGTNATLTLAPGEHYLGCGDLRIHVGGKLVIPGSGAKIKCHTARGNLP